MSADCHYREVVASTFERACGTTGPASVVLAGGLLASATLAQTFEGVHAPIRTAAVVMEQPYPTKPLRLIVPYPAGGGVDTVARVLGVKLGDILGQQVVIDNRPGANGIIGSDITAKAPADGYTMLMQSVAHAINASLYRKLPYDTVKDFAAVTLVNTQPNLLVVYPSLPVASVRELLAMAKSKPGVLTLASPGNGSSAHLSGELLKIMAGVDILHVPYRGGVPALNDLMGGRVSLTFSSVSLSTPLVTAGKLRALAITSLVRSTVVPDLPTVAETIPGYESSTWYGIFLPGGAPGKIVTKVNREIAKVLRAPEVRDRLTLNGAEIVADTPEQFTAKIKADIAKWGEVVRASGARVD
jgi:tripartite-type tricarboxylate transporter receptor subunit TctC